MKQTFSIFLTFLFCFCGKENNSKIFVLDSKLIDSTNSVIQFVSNRRFSQFKTPIEVRFFANDKLIDSIIEPDFKMISWYSNRNDTIELVAHINTFEATSLLLRFIDGKPNVFYYRASHSGQYYFRTPLVDTFADQIEIPPKNYKLKLSQIPDTTFKQVIYGQIEMESTGYFDQRDTLNKERKIKMKFNFRSQFRSFSY